MSKYKLPIVILIGVAILIGLAWALGSSWGPLAVAFTLAYLTHPLILKLERCRIPRTIAMTVIFVAITAMVTLAVVWIVPKLVNDLADLIRTIPELSQRGLALLNQLIARASSRINLQGEGLLNLFTTYLPQINLKTLKPFGFLIQKGFMGVTNLLSLVINVIIIPVFFFHLVNHFESYKKNLLELIPAAQQKKALTYIERFDGVLAAYIRGQLLVCVFLAAFYATGLTLLGVRFGLVIGVIAGLLNIIPYVGFTLGLSAALTLAIIDQHGWTIYLGVVAIFASAQALEGLVITPRIVGSKVGLSALASMLALIIGANLAGFAGMLVAIPVAGIAKLIMVDLIATYKNSSFYKLRSS